jgi:hypothetical protein
MTTTTGYVLRTGRLRRAGALVKVPRVVIAAVLWLMVIEALPGLAAWGVLAVVVGGTVSAVVAEPVIVRLVWWARRPSTPVAVAGEPQVRVLVTRRSAAGIGQAGRRHLIVPTSWVGRADLPALLWRARLRQVASAGRLEVAYQWFTWPWQVLGSFIDGFAHGVSRLPLIGFAWRVRLVVTGVALWQTVVAGRIAATVGIVVVIGLTYLLPWTKAHEERLVRAAVAAAALPLAVPEPLCPPTRLAEPAAAHDGRRPCARAVRGGNRACGQRLMTPELGICRGEGSRGRRAYGRRTTGRKGFQS